MTRQFCRIFESKREDATRHYPLTAHAEPFSSSSSILQRARTPRSTSVLRNRLFPSVSLSAIHSSTTSRRDSDPFSSSSRPQILPSPSTTFERCFYARTTSCSAFLVPLAVKAERTITDPFVSFRSSPSLPLSHLSSLSAYIHNHQPHRQGRFFGRDELGDPRILRSSFSSSRTASGRRELELGAGGRGGETSVVLGGLRVRFASKYESGETSSHGS